MHLVDYVKNSLLLMLQLYSARLVSPHVVDSADNALAGKYSHVNRFQLVSWYKLRFVQFCMYLQHKIVHTYIIMTQNGAQ